jgi:hypothetical protein
MKPGKFEYHVPSSQEDVIAIVNRYDKDAKVLHAAAAFEAGR